MTLHNRGDEADFFAGVPRSFRTRLWNNLDSLKCPHIASRSGTADPEASSNLRLYGGSSEVKFSVDLEKGRSHRNVSWVGKLSPDNSRQVQTGRTPRLFGVNKIQQREGPFCAR